MVIEVQSGRQMCVGISGGKLIENVVDGLRGGGGLPGIGRGEERVVERGMLGKKACQPPVTSSSLS
jgi:hypothetical protein